MNNELKQSFLENTYNYDFMKYNNSLMKAIDDNETRLGKDLKDFNEDEIEGVIKSIDVCSQSSLSSAFAMIRKYKEYNAVLGNSICEVDWNNPKLKATYYRNTLKAEYISSKDFEYLMAQFDSNDGYELYQKTVIMAIRESLAGNYFEDLMALKEDNIEGNVVHLKNRDVIISGGLKDNLLTLKKIDYVQSRNRIITLEPIVEGGLFKFSVQTEETYEEKKKKVYENIKKLAKRAIERKGMNVTLATIEKSKIIDDISEFTEIKIEDGSIMLDNVKDKNKVDDILEMKGVKTGINLYFYRNKEIFLLSKQSKEEF